MNAVAQATGFPAPTGSFGSGFAWAFSRDLTLSLRHPGETLLVIAFFALVASLFPLGVGAEPQLLARIGPGVIWVCACLAAFLSMPALFASDYADSTLEQMTLSPHPMPGWVCGKIAAHWTVSGLPLTVLGLEPETRVLVTEMGMRGLGQIAELCAIARPTLALVTSIGPEHLELVGTVDDVARANAEAIDALPSGGTAVVPAGESLLEPYLRDDLVVRRFHPESVEREDDGWRFALDGEDMVLPLPFAQRHLAENVLAALTAYDMQKLTQISRQGLSGEAEGRAAIMGALALYLDFINLFLFLLRIFGQSR